MFPLICLTIAVLLIAGVGFVLGWKMRGQYDADNAEMTRYIFPDITPLGTREARR